MKKLIETTQATLIECDNPVCDYNIPNPTGSPLTETKDYINMPCPKCGENLLTLEDYLTHKKVLKIITWLNKWFSWLTIFSFRKNEKTFYTKVHKGITIGQEKPVK
jgi:ssDNA-binding Zn-finger/Zn-ribbon topoisomerase 1